MRGFLKNFFTNSKFTVFDLRSKTVKRFLLFLVLFIVIFTAWYYLGDGLVLRNLQNDVSRWFSGCRLSVNFETDFVRKKEAKPLTPEEIQELYTEERRKQWRHWKKEYDKLPPYVTYLWIGLSVGTAVYFVFKIIKKSLGED